MLLQVHGSVHTSIYVVCFSFLCVFSKKKIKRYWTLGRFETQMSDTLYCPWMPYILIHISLLYSQVSFVLSLFFCCLVTIWKLLIALNEIPIPCPNLGWTQVLKSGQVMWSLRVSSDQKEVMFSSCFECRLPGCLFHFLLIFFRDTK